MGLQLKGDGDNSLSEGQVTENVEKTVNPWDVPGKGMEEDAPYQTKTIHNSMTATIQGQEKQDNPIVTAIVRIIIGLVVCAVLFLGGKAIVSVVMPEGEDITNLLTRDANTIAAELGVTFTDNTEWVSQIHQYSKGTVTVKAADGIGIVYIDGKQAGVHIRSKAYTIFDIQIGDGERHVYNNTSYPYDNFLSILNDMAAGKTTTYFYYNQERNDCVALTINDTTNRIVGMTYFYDFNKIMETIDRF